MTPAEQTRADQQQQEDRILRLQCLAAAGNNGTTEQQILRAQTIYDFVTDTAENKDQQDPIPFLKEGPSD